MSDLLQKPQRLNRTDLEHELSQLKGWDRLDEDDKSWGIQTAAFIHDQFPELRVGRGDENKVLAFSVSDQPDKRKDRRLALRLDKNEHMGFPITNNRPQRIHLRVAYEYLISKLPELAPNKKGKAGLAWIHEKTHHDKAKVKEWIELLRSKYPSEQWMHPPERHSKERLTTNSDPAQRAKAPKYRIEIEGGGFPSAEERKQVEQAAIKHVRLALKKDSYRIRDRQRDNCGYDLLATSDTEILEIEVKGTRREEKYFYLTKNERQRAEASADWRLYLVSNALEEEPVLHKYTWPQLETAFDMNALAWRCQFKPS